jgi:hypothetical protein
MKRSNLAGAILLATLSTPAFATNFVTIKFVGDCTDCAGQATATLVLKNFSLDGVNPNLQNNNFFSFTYDGSNLFYPYTLTSDVSLSGNLTRGASNGPGLVGVNGNFSISGLSFAYIRWVFTATPQGSWAVSAPGGGAPEDYGTNAVFTSPTAVPETASWAMVIAGFGLIGGTLRRHRTNVRFA